MPQWKQYSGTWPLQTQMQAVAAGTWTGITINKLYTWGNQSSGRLGLNDAINRSSPTQVGSDTNWNFVTSSVGNNSAAIKTNGTLWTWGANAYGELGVNNQIETSSPVQVGALTNWSKVTFASQWCLAIKTDGTLWSWGRNRYGSLGLNDAVSRSSPVQIGALNTWQTICVTDNPEAAFAIKTDGTLWSWGNNTYGQLAQNDTVYRSSPVQVGALTNWSYISGFPSGYGVAVKTDGTLWSWGYNPNGQLGTNDVVYRSSPVQVGALTNWSKVSGGGSFVTSIKTDGTLWSWGNNAGGQLGQNNLDLKSSPVQIGALTTWSQIGSGGARTFALKTDNTLWAWGTNSSGPLGDGTVVSRSSPVQIGADTWNVISTNAGLSNIALK